MLALYNVSQWSEKGWNPTIIIKKSDPEWEQAYKNWEKQNNPTDSPEWKKGVILGSINEKKD